MVIKTVDNLEKQVQSTDLNFGRNFILKKMTERSLKCACHSVDWMVTKWYWNATENHLSRHPSVAIQSPFSRPKGEISSCQYIRHF